MAAGDGDTDYGTRVAYLLRSTFLPFIYPARIGSLCFQKGRHGAASREATPLPVFTSRNDLKPVRVVTTSLRRLDAKRRGLNELCSYSLLPSSHGKRELNPDLQRGTAWLTVQSHASSVYIVSMDADSSRFAYAFGKSVPTCHKSRMPPLNEPMHGTDKPRNKTTISRPFFTPPRNDATRVVLDFIETPSIPV